MERVRITEYLTIDLETEMWCCERCGADLVSARQPYQFGCLVHDRPATEVYGAPVELGEKQRLSYAPDPDFSHILEFYCPSCGAMVEVQYLPPGHPIPVDITLDIDRMKERYRKE